MCLTNLGIILSDTIFPAFPELSETNYKRFYFSLLFRYCSLVASDVMVSVDMAEEGGTSRLGGGGGQSWGDGANVSGNSPEAGHSRACLLYTSDAADE